VGASIPGTVRAAFGLGLAQAAFAATFRGPRERFWQRMTLTGLTLGGYALLARKEPREVKVGGREVAMGLASAAALYATFQIGDRFARRFVPTGERDIEEIYALRELRPRVEIVEIAELELTCEGDLLRRPLPLLPLPRHCLLRACD